MIHGRFSILIRLGKFLNMPFLNMLALAAEFGDVHSYDVNTMERFLRIFVASLSKVW